MINKDDNEINFKRYSGDYLYSNYRKNVIEDNLYEDGSTYYHVPDDLKKYIDKKMKIRFL